MIHQLVKGCRGSGAFQTDVESNHAQVIHYGSEVFFQGIYNPVCAHLFSQVGPVGTGLSGHHKAGAGKAGHGHSHASNEPGTGNQHIFPDHREGEGCMCGISQRVHDGKHLIRNAVIESHYVVGGNLHILGEGTVDVHPDSYGGLADVLAAAPAIPAVPAGDVSFAGYPFTLLKFCHFTPRLGHMTHILMPDGQSHRDGLLGPVIPVVYMQVGSANGRFADLDQYIVGAGNGNGNVFHPDSLFCFGLYQCFHKAKISKYKSLPQYEWNVFQML